MDGKRPSEDKGHEPKRAKTDFPLYVVLDGVEYINLSCLLKTASFAAYHKKHYEKSERRFIEKEQLEVLNVTRENIANGIFKPKDAYSPARDLRLVKMDGEEINNFRTVVHMHALEMLSKDAELAKKDYELELSKKEQELIAAKKDVAVAVELAKKDVTISEMTIAAKDRRIQELEEKLRRSKTKNANAA